MFVALLVYSTVRVVSCDNIFIDYFELKFLTVILIIYVFKIVEVLMNF